MLKTTKILFDSKEETCTTEDEVKLLKSQQFVKGCLNMPKVLHVVFMDA